MKRFFLYAFFFCLASPLVSAQTRINDIRVEGLQRIAAETVFSALPLNVGDLITQQAVAQSSRALFATGNFDDIQIGVDKDVLVVRVTERPAISKINIEGNKALATDALLDGLKGAGLAEGQVFKRATLENMRMELTRQYVSQGRYDAGIETDVVAEPRNRVSISINIDEGSTASIKHINIVGNDIFSDDELLTPLALQSTNFWSWYSSDNKYSREKLAGDLETLRSYYLDRGYIRFNVESTQVSVSPDKRGVYITISVTEGELYNIRDVKLAGDLVVDEDELTRLYMVKEGDVFSRRRVTFTSDLMTKRLGNDGYTFAKVNGIPKIDDDERLVDASGRLRCASAHGARGFRRAGSESVGRPHRVSVGGRSVRVRHCGGSFAPDRD